MKLTRTQKCLMHGAQTVLVLFPSVTTYHYARVYPTFHSPAETVADSLYGDWVKVGMDIHRATQKQINVENPSG